MDHTNNIKDNFTHLYIKKESPTCSICKMLCAEMSDLKGALCSFEEIKLRSLIFLQQ